MPDSLNGHGIGLQLMIYSVAVFGLVPDVDLFGYCVHFNDSYMQS